jgi:hypothetical protein
MPATKTTLTGGKFQDSEGNILQNGYLRLFLNQDEVVTGVGSICSGVFVQVQLDVNGSAVAGQSIWSNDVMSPVNSFYRVFGYAANGQLAWGPNNQQIIFGSGTFDLGTWIPNSVISWQPPLQPLTLQTNGVNNGSQFLLNFNAGSGVTLVDNGSGQVTISAGSTTVFDVNGTPTSSQSTINFQSGTGIAVSNPSAGNVLITNTSPGTIFSTANQGYFFGPGIPLPIPLFDGQSGETIVQNANEVRVTQFSLASSYTIRKIAVNITTAAGFSPTVSFGIYSIAGNKLLDSGGISASSTGVQIVTLGTPITLPAGSYYFAQSASASTVQVPGSGTSISAVLYNQWNAVNNYHALASNAVLLGVLPATLGLLTAIPSIQFTGVSMPLFMV